MPLPLPVKWHRGTGTMEYKDYYKIMSVDKNATAKEIKKAYIARGP